MKAKKMTRTTLFGIHQRFSQNGKAKHNIKALNKVLGRRIGQARKAPTNGRENVSVGHSIRPWDKQNSKTSQTSYNTTAQTQSVQENVSENFDISAPPKKTTAAKYVAHPILCSAQKLQSGRNQTSPSNTESISHSIPTRLWSFEDARICGAFMDLENSNIPIHKWHKKTSMDTRLKKSWFQSEVESTEIDMFLEQKHLKPWFIGSDARMKNRIATSKIIKHTTSQASDSVKAADQTVRRQHRKVLLRSNCEFMVYLDAFEHNDMKKETSGLKNVQQEFCITLIAPGETGDHYTQANNISEIDDECAHVTPFSWASNISAFGTLTELRSSP